MGRVFADLSRENAARRSEGPPRAQRAVRRASASGSTPARSSLPWLAALLLFALAATAALAQCTLEETTVMGEPAAVLENEFVRIRVRPTVGGRIDQLVYKPTDSNLTSPTDGAVFVDRIWNYANPDVYRQWMTSSYTAVTDASPDRVAITLSGPGFVGPGKFMAYEKTFSLTAGSSAIRANYRFSVQQDAMQPLRVGLWWHNRLGLAQEENTYYLPTREGVGTTTYGAGGGGQYWWNDPARGWAAVVGESGVGCATIMDLGPLMLAYNYLGGDVAGLEWAFRSREIDNGSSMETTAWILPFDQMGAVAGACERVVVGVDRTPTTLDAPGELPVALQLAAPEALSAQVTLSARRLPDGAASEVASFSADLQPATTDERAIPVTLDQEGTWVLEGAVSAGGEQIADFFHEVVVGERSGRIAIEPNVDLVGRVGERFEDKIAAKGTGPEDRHPSEEIVTPHVPWAKPLAGGPLRALIVNDLLTGREVVELAQRLDLDYDAPTISTAYAIGRATQMFGAEVTVDWALDNLRKLLQANSYDVILMGGLPCDLYGEDVVALILNQVRAGAGLVWVNPNKCSDELWAALPVGEMASASRPTYDWRAEADHYLTAGVPWEALPPTQVCRYADADGAEVLARAGSFPLVATKPLGEGRVVALGYNTSWQGPGTYSTGLTPWVQFAPTRFAYWEYHHALLAKSMIFAAGREPQAAISSLAVEPAEPTQAQAPKLRLALAADPGEPLAGELRLVNEFGDVLSTDPVEVASAEAALPLPEGLPGGRYLADLILRDADGAAVDFGSATFTVSPRIEVVELAVPDEIYRAGDTVEASVMLTAIQPAPAQAELVATLTDTHGRAIARSSQQAQSSGAATVSLELPEPLTTLATLRVEVRDGDAVLDAAEADVLMMPKWWYDREWEPWLDTMWGGPAGAYSREYLANIETERVKQLGVDAVTTSSSWLHDGEQLNFFTHGFQAIVLGMSRDVLHMDNVRGEGMVKFSEAREQYAKTNDRKFLERPWPLGAQRTKDYVLERVEEATAATARYRPVGYNCGDELSVTYYVTPFDYDFSPESLAQFRAWLQEQYQTLAALNAEWETDFATWDAVTPMPADEARGRGNFAPWADHRTFMEVSYADFFRFVDDEIEARDPGARLGISGTQAAEAYGGYDWSRLTDALDFGQTYDHKTTGEMQRSFGGLLTAPWWGYAQTDPALGHRLWQRLLNNADGGSYFTWSYVYWPDLTWTQSTADSIPHMEQIQGGIARLLDSCEERAADVWVHYSQPSVHGAWITGGQNAFSENRSGWVKAIEDLGMQMEFVSYAQIEDGALTDAMPGALVLPYSVALSDAEVAQIEAYARAGGVVIGDARIGLMDEHCRTRETGALDALFGVRHVAIDPAARRPEGEASFSRALDGADPTGISFQGYAGEEIALTTGQALGEMAGRPALVLNNVGEGRAILLNMLVDSYLRRVQLGVDEPLRSLIAETLKFAGVASPIGVSVTGGHHAYVARYVDGGTTFVGVVRDLAEGGAQVTLDLGAPTQVYDVREGRSLGRKARVTASLESGECVLYALLPYEVTGVRVRPREETVSRGDEVSYTVSVEANAEPGLHVYRVEVTDPTGDRREWYDAQVTAERGVASGAFGLALNDEPGRWTIRATDVATGVTGEAQVAVE